MFPCALVMCVPSPRNAAWGVGRGVEERELRSSRVMSAARRPFSAEVRAVPCSRGPTGTCKRLQEALPEGASGDLGESDRKRHSFRTPVGVLLSPPGAPGRPCPFSHSHIHTVHTAWSQCQPLSQDENMTTSQGSAAAPSFPGCRHVPPELSQWRCPSRSLTLPVWAHAAGRWPRGNFSQPPPPCLELGTPTPPHLLWCKWSKDTGGPTSGSTPHPRCLLRMRTRVHGHGLSANNTREACAAGRCSRVHTGMLCRGPPWAWISSHLPRSIPPAEPHTPGRQTCGQLVPQAHLKAAARGVKGTGLGSGRAALGFLAALLGAGSPHTKDPFPVID